VAAVLIGSTGAEIGVPFLANDGDAKAYVHSLGEAHHYEFKPLGVYVTVVPSPAVRHAGLAKLGLEPRTIPMKPMSVEQCVSEGLNRSRIIPSRLHRIMNALAPASVKRTMTAKMLGKTLARRHSPANARAEA
jgi:short-subunit dehydrogenase